MSEKMIHTACYGSLKSGFHNQPVMGDNAKFVGHILVHGVMYLCGNYPKLYAAVGTEGPLREELARNHVCEVWAIPESNYADVENMELWAGYQTRVLNTEFSDDTRIFLMPGRRVSEHEPHIEAYTYEVLAEKLGRYPRQQPAQERIQVPESITNKPVIRL